MFEHSYKQNDPCGWFGDPSRGAALGRYSVHAENPGPVKLALRKVRLDAGGYDSNGTYFGTGGWPLYWIASSDGAIDYMIRAESRPQARAIVRQRYPGVRFYR